MVILIFGATGSAGGGVLQACLSVARRHRESGPSRGGRWPSRTPGSASSSTRSFDDYSAIADAFAGVDACLYCLGKSSTQVSGEAEYRRLTYDYALAAARAVWRGSPNAVFQFISGASTRIDSRYMWARVKAETERDLLADGHPANCWRPASIDGVPSASEPVLFRRGAAGDAPAEAVPQPLRPSRGHRARDAGRDGAGDSRANLRERRDPRPRGPCARQA